jgi:hypothetical protein
MRHDNSIKHGNYVKFGKHNLETDVQQKSGLKLNPCKCKAIVWEQIFLLFVVNMFRRLLECWVFVGSSLGCAFDYSLNEAWHFTLLQNFELVHEYATNLLTTVTTYWGANEGKKI